MFIILKYPNTNKYMYVNTLGGDGMCKVLIS